MEPSRIRQTVRHSRHRMLPVRQSPSGGDEIGVDRLELRWLGQGLLCRFVGDDFGVDRLELGWLGLGLLCRFVGEQFGVDWSFDDETGGDRWEVLLLLLLLLWLRLTSAFALQPASQTVPQCSAAQRRLTAQHRGCALATPSHLHCGPPHWLPRRLHKSKL